MHQSLKIAFVICFVIFFISAGADDINGTTTVEPGKTLKDQTSAFNYIGIYANKFNIKNTLLKLLISLFKLNVEK